MLDIRYEPSSSRQVKHLKRKRYEMEKLIKALRLVAEELLSTITDIMHSKETFVDSASFMSKPTGYWFIGFSAMHQPWY